MMNEKFTTAALAVYFIAWLIYTISYLRKSEQINRVALYTAATGGALQVIGFFLRWYESYQVGAGHFPAANLYEALVFFAMVITLIFLVIEYRFRLKWIGTFVMPVVFLTLGYTSFLNNEIEPLVPALQSNWLTVHVITSFLGYAGFAVAFGAGIFYLFQEKRAEQSLLDAVDNTIYVAVGFGFITLTLGIITGAVWANYAWGSYWSWDPKETWSLITWLVYGALLHARFRAGWKGHRTAIMAIIGFVVTLFCFLGVNLFLSGLHSYA